jgi:hypothetical protein
MTIEHTVARVATGALGFAVGFIFIVGVLT